MSPGRLRDLPGAVDAAEGAASEVMDEATHAMHGAMDKAEDVGTMLDDHKAAIDDAMEEAEDAEDAVPGD